MTRSRANPDPSTADHDRIENRRARVEILTRSEPRYTLTPHIAVASAGNTIAEAGPTSPRMSEPTHFEPITTGILRRVSAAALSSRTLPERRRFARRTFPRSSGTICACGRRASSAARSSAPMPAPLACPRPKPSMSSFGCFRRRNQRPHPRRPHPPSPAGSASSKWCRPSSVTRMTMERRSRLLGSDHGPAMRNGSSRATRGRGFGYESK
jgi:hypothetical protein